MDCKICLQPGVIALFVMLVACSHIFHNSCMDRLARDTRRDPQCPICHTPFCQPRPAIRPSVDAPSTSGTSAALSTAPRGVSSSAAASNLAVDASSPSADADGDLFLLLAK